MDPDLARLEVGPARAQITPPAHTRLEGHAESEWSVLTAAPEGQGPEVGQAAHAKRSLGHGNAASASRAEQKRTGQHWLDVINTERHAGSS